MKLGISISRRCLPIEKMARVLLDVHLINILSFVALTSLGSPEDSNIVRPWLYGNRLRNIYGSSSVNDLRAVSRPIDSRKPYTNRDLSNRQYGVPHIGRARQSIAVIKIWQLY